ncbi:protein translocase subunit SecF [Nocardioides sp.]|uniref:protein translocase subunit SecF n=1 Tax=Nocardioides sp. TaxID=35761 RepID=UPI00261F2E5A|nr:protein translocase subunit SecF [Nocardioides sp.]
MRKYSRLGHELYTGEKSFDFIGKRGIWYAISGGIVLAALLVVLLKGLAFGVEFTGGVQFQLSNLTSSQATQKTVDDLRETIANSGIKGATEPTVATSGKDGISVEVEELTQADSDKLLQVITKEVGIDAKQVSQDEIGASWGAEVAKRALTGVVVFLVLSMLFIGIYFREWKMSAAAFIALFHDVVITMGIYSLSGFKVTPAAVTGVLAILGFSLYDTVVVFDKIRENTHQMKAKKTTYARAANLAVNQTLVRSINTSVVALIPIGAILYVSAVQLGASSLKDLALAQFVGMAAGVFSSVWVAPRILVHLKSGENEVKLAEKRARARERSDKYANVPSFTENMAVAEEPDELEEYGDDDGDTGAQVGAGPRQASNTSAYGKGRIAPAPNGPVEDSGAAGRPQPSRKPRSQRGKK